MLSLAWALMLTFAQVEGSTTATTAPSWGDQPFEVTADSMQADVRARIFMAEGHVLFRRGEVVVSADRIIFWEREERALAEGEVVVLRQTEVLSCRRVEMKLPELAGGVEQFDLRIKSGVTAAELEAQLAERGDLRAGNNEMILGGEHLERTGPRRFKVEGGSFTPCDCGGDSAPSWKIRAMRASVDMDSGAWLVAPVFYASDVPVFVLPAIYIPLGDRRTGLLTPRFGYDSVTGWQLTLPVFFALHRSFDATLDATYYTSRGFAPAAEMRWAPGERSQGSVKTTIFFDDGAYDAADRSWGRDRDGAIVRYSVVGRHDSRGEQSAFATDLNLVSDPRLIGELGGGFLERQAEESVSRMTYSNHALGPMRVSAGLALRQDLRPQRYPRPGGEELREVSLFSIDSPGPGAVRYRLAELRMDALPSVLGPSAWAPVGEARFSVQGFVAPNPDTPRFVRADFRPALSWPIDLFRVASLRPSVALRMTGWSGRSEDRTETLGRLAVIARTDLSTEISRPFGRLRHRIRPAVHHLIIPELWGDDLNPFDTRDEIDTLSIAHQVAVSLETDLWDSSRGGKWFLLGARIGSDLDVGDHQGVGLSPLVLTAELNLLGLIPSSRAQLGARAGVDVERGRLEEIVGTLNWSTGRWLGVTLLYGEFAGDVPRSTFIAPEELIPSATIDRSRYLSSDEYNSALASGDLDVVRWSAYRGITSSLKISPWTPLTLGGVLSVDFDPPELDGGKTADQQRDDSPIRNVGGFVRYESLCKCWSAEVAVGFARDRDGPDVRFSLDLARLGGVSSP